MSQTLLKTALKNRYRFHTPSGTINTEDLWSLPLTTSRKNAANLDDIAKGIHKQLRESQETSFVKKKSSSSTILSNKLEIVKLVIEDKMLDAERKERAEQRAAKKQRLMELIEEKELANEKDKSIDELRRELAMMD